jgi:hypothetical protein
MATVTQLPGDKMSQNPDGIVITRRYHVFGATGLIDAVNTAGIPAKGAAYPGSTKIRAVKIECEDLFVGGDRMHAVTVTYERSYVKASEPTAGDESWTYETTDIGAHIDTAFSTARYPATAPDHGNLINVQPDGSVAGIDISDYMGTLTITKWYDYDDVLSAMDTWESLVNTTNAAAFKVIFEANTLRFIGYRISPSFDNDRPTQVDFTFLRGKNLTAYDLPNYIDRDGNTISVTGGKNAHDAIGVVQVPVEDGAGLYYNMRVQGVYVYNVYDEGDFSLFDFEATLVVNDLVAGS